MKLKNLKTESFLQEHFMHKTLEKKLDELLPEIFPVEDLNKIKSTDKNKTQKYTAKYLPFHTRHEAWLANYIVKLVKDLQTKLSLDGKKSAYKMLGDVTRADAIRYMKTSTEFVNKRNVYEQDLVKAYILLLRNNTSDDFYTVAEEKQAIIKHKNCLNVFRNRIMEAMRFLGLPENVIDLEIEKKRNLWYSRMQNHTFANKYIHLPAIENNRNFIFPNLYQEWCGFDDSINKFNVLWKKLNDYQYYQAYKPVIDKAGMANQNMKISKSQSVFLLKKTNEAFQQYCAKYKNLMNKVLDAKENTDLSKN